MSAGTSSEPGDAGRPAIALGVVGCLFILQALLPHLEVATPLGSLGALDLVVGVVFVTAAVEMRVTGERSRGRVVVEQLAARFYRLADRPSAPAARTVLVSAGLASTLLAVTGVLAFRADGGATRPAGDALGLAALFLAMVALVGLTAVGVGASFPRHGGRLTIPPADFSPLQRVLVTGGSLLTAKVPVTIGALLAIGAGGSYLVSTAWTVGILGLEVLLAGMVWTGVDVVRRWVPVGR